MSLVLGTRSLPGNRSPGKAGGIHREPPKAADGHNTSYGSATRYAFDLSRPLLPQPPALKGYRLETIGRKR
jgi:hypothetical protein